MLGDHVDHTNVVLYLDQLDNAEIELTRSKDPLWLLPPTTHCKHKARTPSADVVTDMTNFRPSP